MAFVYQTEAIPAHPVYANRATLASIVKSKLIHADTTMCLAWREPRVPNCRKAPRSPAFVLQADPASYVLIVSGPFILSSFLPPHLAMLKYMYALVSGWIVQCEMCSVTECFVFCFLLQFNGKCIMNWCPTFGATRSCSCPLCRVWPKRLSSRFGSCRGPTMVLFFIMASSTRLDGETFFPCLFWMAIFSIDMISALARPTLGKFSRTFSRTFKPVSQFIQTNLFFLANLQTFSWMAAELFFWRKLIFFGHVVYWYLMNMFDRLHAYI